MAIQVDYLLLCDSAFSDERGKHCIIGVFDTIQAQTFPALHPSMALAVRLMGQPAEVLRVKIEIGRPNGDVLASLPIEPVAGPDGGCNVSMGLNQFQFPEAGRYTLKVLSGRDVLASRSVRLLKIDAPPPVGHQNPPQQEKKKLH